MQLTSSPNLTKHEMDSGRKAKAAYYDTILSGKNDHGLRSTLRAPFSPAQEVILHLHPECAMPQQDLTLTAANKFTCMPR